MLTPKVRKYITKNLGGNINAMGGVGIHVTSTYTAAEILHGVVFGGWRFPDRGQALKKEDTDKLRE